MHTFLRSVALSTACFSVSLSAHADVIADILHDGAPYIHVRYRYEQMEQERTAEIARASTLKTRLGFRSGSAHGIRIGVEFDNVVQLGSDNYNDTINGRTEYPVIADPEYTELNQAYIRYSGIEHTTLTVGRERYALDNHRFIGHVGWRQNDQTFDGANTKIVLPHDTSLFYGFISNVNRIFGDDSPVGDSDSNSHLIQIENKTSTLAHAKVYAYILDLEDIAAQSSKTFGGFIKGKANVTEDLGVHYRIEYARQSDHGDNPIDYHADYVHIAPGVSYNGLTLTLGYELLGSDNGIIGFSTPLSTLHKFNGLTDKFLVTPNTGLEDYYVSADYTLKQHAGALEGMVLNAQYHEFVPDQSGADFGKEYSFRARKDINDHYYAQAGYAHYDAQARATDTDWFYMMIGASF